MREKSSWERKRLKEKEKKMGWWPMVLGMGGGMGGERKKSGVGGECKKRGERDEK